MKKYLLLLILSVSILNAKSFYSLNFNKEDGLYYEDYEFKIKADGTYKYEAKSFIMDKIQKKIYKNGKLIEEYEKSFDKEDRKTIVRVSNPSDNSFKELTYKGSDSKYNLVKEYSQSPNSYHTKIYYEYPKIKEETISNTITTTNNTKQLKYSSIHYFKSGIKKSEQNETGEYKEEDRGKSYFKKKIPINSEVSYLEYAEDKDVIQKINRVNNKLEGEQHFMQNIRFGNSQYVVEFFVEAKNGEFRNKPIRVSILQNNEIMYNLDAKFKEDSYKSVYVENIEGFDMKNIKKIEVDKNDYTLESVVESAFEELDTSNLSSLYY